MQISVFIAMESWPTLVGLLFGAVWIKYIWSTHTCVCTQAFLLENISIVVTDSWFSYMIFFFFWNCDSQSLAWFCLFVLLLLFVWLGSVGGGGCFCFFESVFLLMLLSTLLETCVLLASATRFTLIFLIFLFWISCSVRKSCVFTWSGY